MICPVCKRKMNGDSKRVYCDLNHSFDKAKSGYINLLLNNTSGGDNKLMIDSRKIILDLGYYRLLAEEITKLVEKYKIKSILDVGSGDGYYSKIIKDALDIEVVGMDISKYACLQASKLVRNVKFIVASVTFIPFENDRFDAILSNFAPHCEAEFNRVAKDYLIKIIPNKNHLLEVKKYLYDDIIIKESKVQDFYGFELIEEVSLKYNIFVKEIYDLVRMTPYYYKTRINEDDIMGFCTNVTFDFKLLVYKKIGGK